MDRDELLNELEKRLNELFESIGFSTPESKADNYREQIQRMYHDAYKQGIIDCMPEDIKVSIDEDTGELQTDILWPVTNQIQLTFSYSPETE